MDRPVEMDFNRKGNPLFADNNMIAFRAHFKNCSRVAEAIKTLCILLSHGETGLDPIGIPVNICLIIDENVS